MPRISPLLAVLLSATVSTAAPPTAGSVSAVAPPPAVGGPDASPPTAGSVFAAAPPPAVDGPDASPPTAGSVFAAAPLPGVDGPDASPPTVVGSVSAAASPPAVGGAAAAAPPPVVMGAAAAAGPPPFVDGATVAAPPPVLDGAATTAGRAPVVDVAPAAAAPFAVDGAMAAAEPPPVVGGSTVPRGRWPDAVAVLLRDGVCTGTLIAPHVVLTAGHCIDGMPREVLLDSVDYAAPGGDRIPVSWSRAYPSWERRYDVGVVVLARAARQIPRVVASTCTAREHLIPNHRVTLVGFGLATASATDSNTALRQATVPITDPTCTLDAGCAAAIAPDGEFMAGGQGADSCFGDSGGPVYATTSTGPVLLGVVSRGLSIPAAPCGGGGIYVRADRVASWIQRVTGVKLTRTRCTGRGDGATTDDEDTDRLPHEDGCAATSASSAGSAFLLLALLVLWSVHARRHRTRSILRDTARAG